MGVIPPVFFVMFGSYIKKLRLSSACFSSVAEVPWDFLDMAISLLKLVDSSRFHGVFVVGLGVYHQNPLAILIEPRRFRTSWLSGCKGLCH